jgi:hypothetical protein
MPRRWPENRTLNSVRLVLAVTCWNDTSKTNNLELAYCGRVASENDGLLSHNYSAYRYWNFHDFYLPSTPVFLMSLS